MAVLARTLAADPTSQQLVAPQDRSVLRAHHLCTSRVLREHAVASSSWWELPLAGGSEGTTVAIPISFTQDTSAHVCNSAEGGIQQKFFTSFSASRLLRTSASARQGGASALEVHREVV